jgi:PAS domain S-box-containing protein
MSQWESSELFKQLADALPVGLYITDPDRKIIYWNHYAERITGYLSHEVLKRSCRDDLLVHCHLNGPPVCNDGNCPLLSALRDGKTHGATYFLRHKHGHRVSVRIQAIPVRNEHGAIVAIAELFQEDTAGNEGMKWEAPSRFDGELGIPTADETREHLRRYLVQHPSRLAVYLIVVEQLNEMGRMRGDGMVRALLAAVAQSVMRLLVAPHYFGWWTGHRFLLLVPNCSPETFQEIHTELRDVGSACGVKWWGDWIIPRVLAYATLAEEHDSPESVIARIAPDTPCEKLPAGDL